MCPHLFKEDLIYRTQRVAETFGILQKRPEGLRVSDLIQEEDH